MEEFILSFLPEQFAYPDIFRIKLAGITYLFASYHVKRQHSRIYSLEYLISGKSEIRIDETAYFPSKGDVYILPRDRDHHYWSDKKNPMHKLCINVSSSLCDHLFQVYQLHQTCLFQQVAVQPLFDELIMSCKTESLSN